MPFPEPSRPLSAVRVLLFSVALAAAALAPARASGDEGPDTTVAQTLFEDGRRLMEAKDYAAACPKFEESLKLRPGTGTLLNLALCNEAVGKTATAWGQFKEVLFASKKEGNEAREAFASEHIAALEPKLSKLQINAESTPGLAIHRDGQEIPAAALGTPIPVDPGEHQIEATAPGYTVWSTSVKVGGEADMKTVAIPKLTPAPAAEVGSKPGTVDDGGTQRMVGFVVGGVGVAAIGVGAVFGLLAAGDASDAEDDPTLCPNKTCTPAGREAIDGASTKALISTIGFGVGAAAVGAGVVLLLTAGSSQPAPTKEASGTRVVPMIGTQGGGLGVLGTF